MPTAILYVDDEPDFELLIRQKYRRQVRRGELALTFASNGVEALAAVIARAEPFDLIVTDINMPEMNGLQLLARLQHQGHETPVLVLSAYGDMVNIRAAMNTGAFDFVTKPIDFADLDKSQAKALAYAEQVRARNRDRAAASEGDDGEGESGADRSNFAELGMMVAGVVHDLKNPLGFISTFTSLSEELIADITEELGDGVSDDVREDLDVLKLNLSKIGSHGAWSLRLVHSILEGAASDEREVDVNAMISDHLDLFAASARARDPLLGLQIAKQLDPTVGTLEVAPQQLVRLVITLVENAYHAVKERYAAGDRFEPKVWVDTRGVEGAIEIVVRDNGPGIPADLREKIFDPFFTTKAPGEGTGLGLHLVSQMVRAHGGWIRAEDNDGQGARMVARLG